jgi:hypothetical protein
MRSTFTLIRRNGYPWWFVAVLAAALLVFWALPAAHQSKELLLSIVGGVAAFFHFLYSQHNHNTERFIELFREFNTRYDKQNDKLNALVLQSPSEPIVDPERLQTLYDYFNLCAEEYLYFRAGYIDSEVWRSWLRGMAYFAAIPEIRRVWQRELEQGSYYGFSLKLLDGAV